MPIFAAAVHNRDQVLHRSVTIGNVIFENVAKNGIIFLKIVYNSNSYFIREQIS